MQEYKTKYGTFSSPFSLSIDTSNIKIRSTLEDFEGDEDMYRIYTEMESLFDEYEKRVDTNLVTENIKNKNHKK